MAMSADGRWHDPAGLSQQEKVDNNTRLFLGEGSPFLRVPGLVALQSVRIGAMHLPLYEAREYPTDRTMRRVETVQEQVVAVNRADDDTPILMRGVISNDGIWQAGAPIYVSGVWEATEAEGPTEPGGTEPAETTEQARRRRGFPARA